MKRPSNAREPRLPHHKNRAPIFLPKQIVRVSPDPLCYLDEGYLERNAALQGLAFQGLVVPAPRFDTLYPWLSHIPSFYTNCVPF